MRGLLTPLSVTLVITPMRGILPPFTTTRKNLQVVQGFSNQNKDPLKLLENWFNKGSGFRVYTIGLSV